MSRYIRWTYGTFAMTGSYSLPCTLTLLDLVPRNIINLPNVGLSLWSTDLALYKAHSLLFFYPSIQSVLGAYPDGWTCTDWVNWEDNQPRYSMGYAPAHGGPGFGGEFHDLYCVCFGFALLFMVFFLFFFCFLCF